MKRVTVMEMQKLVDSCSGYSLNFVKCMTRKLNELLKTKTYECNEHRQAIELPPVDPKIDQLVDRYFAEQETKKPKKLKKPTVVVGSTSTDDCKT